MHIRTASLADAAALAAVEAACFPPAEAATAAEIADRLAYYADHFWLLEEDDGTLVSFVDGMTTDEPTLRDEMYENAALHDEDGTWQMIFGVNTLPAYRRRGCAGAVLDVMHIGNMKKALAGDEIMHVRDYFREKLHKER